MNRELGPRPDADSHEETKEVPEAKVLGANSLRAEREHVRTSHLEITLTARQAPQHVFGGA